MLEPCGPPWVITSMAEKDLNALMNFMIKTKERVGVISGSVILRRIVHRLALSSLAAS